MSGAAFLAFDEEALLALANAVRRTGYRFVTVTPATHERVNRRPGNAWARSWARNLADVFGWSRPFRAGVLPQDMFDLARRAGVLAPHEDGWRSLVRFSSLDDELFVHSAYPTTDVDAVFFGPDTGRLVDAVTASLPGGHDRPIRRAADIGCGAGAGAIAVAKRARGGEVIGVDINPAALRATALNARLAGVANVVSRASDMLHDLEGDFDLIVSNPPFMVDAAERAYRHGGGPLGAGLPLACVDAAVERLAPGGALVLFTGVMVIEGETPFRDEAARRLDAGGLAWSYREVDPDVYGEELDNPGYAQADRIALAVLTARKEN
jgi:release factor glutamine methyltransferase